MLHFHVPSLSCGGCAKSVIRALQPADPGAEVNVDLANRRIAVETAVDERTVQAALTGAGFPAKWVPTAG